VDVDACERDPERAMRVNAGLVRDLVSDLDPDCLLVQISTDAVFDGTASFRRERDVPAPRNVYGRSKLAGEMEAARHPHNLIVRTNLYGWSSGRKKTSAEWMYGALRRQEDIVLYTDYFFTPLYAADLADILAALIGRGARGLFHVAGGERVSKHGFGETMARLMGTRGASMDHVKKGLFREGRHDAPRAADVSLDGGRAAAFSGIPAPTCEAGLVRFLNENPHA
jgi:dTDP-4-dehydrorhamnose reductase